MQIPRWDIREGRNEEDIRIIARSMETEAQMQPIILGEEIDGAYEIVDGVHRYLAAKRLDWKEIDCMRLSGIVEDQTAAALSNLGRVTMSPTDTQQVVDYYLQNTDLQYQEIADKLGVSPSVITRHAKVSNGHNEIQNRYMGGDVTLQGAAALSQVPDRDAAVAILNDAERLGLNTNEIKAMAAHATARINQREVTTQRTDPQVTEEVREDVKEQVRQHEDEMESDIGTALAKDKNRKADRPSATPSQADPEPDGTPTPDPPSGATTDGVHGAQSQSIDQTCMLCGGEWQQHTRALFVPPQTIQNELGLREIEMCADCAKDVYSGIKALQESAPEDS